MSTTSPQSLAEALTVQINVELVEARMAKGVLAKKVGISPRTLTRYLNGERQVTFEQLVKFADAFDLSAAELVRRSEKRLNKK